MIKGSVARLDERSYFQVPDETEVEEANRKKPGIKDQLLISGVIIQGQKIGSDA